MFGIARNVIVIPVLRWPQSICLAVAGVILSAYVLPFRDSVYPGAEIDRWPESYARATALVMAVVPLAVLIFLVRASRRFRLGITPWKAALVTFVVDLAVMTWVMLSF